MQRVVSTLGPLATAPHDLAVAAAVEVMAGGGNAVDAAIAADAVLTVVAPETCGIGGDLFALIHRPGEQAPLCLNASGRAGSGASAAALRDDGYDDMPLFHRAAITVPGCVDGWEALLDTAGTRSLEDLLAPAITLAVDGFEVSHELALTIDRRADELRTQPSAAPFYGADGAPVTAGSHMRRPRLAGTLSAIAAGGRAAFYEGAFGEALREASEHRITPDDVAVRQAEWVEPLGRPVFGRTLWTVPPNTQGYITPAALRIFEMLDPPDDPDHPEYHHLLIESYLAASWDRDDVATDPDTAPLPAAELVADERLAERAARIDRNRAGHWPALRQVPGGTAYLCTMDAAGVGVSFIQSNFYGIGSGFSAGDTGVWLHNRGGGFTLEPGHPNELAPGRRPLHTLAPTLWTAGDALSLLLGTRGGRLQPQLLSQVAAHLEHAGEHLEAAQHRPRWAIREPEGPVLVEDHPALAEALTARGHAVEPQGRWVGGWGPVSIIRVDDAGLRHGAADPRVATASTRTG